jgi:hypothetical protein
MRSSFRQIVDEAVSAKRILVKSGCFARRNDGMDSRATRRSSATKMGICTGEV